MRDKTAALKFQMGECAVAIERAANLMHLASEYAQASEGERAVRLLKDARSSVEGQLRDLQAIASEMLEHGPDARTVDYER